MGATGRAGGYYAQAFGAPPNAGMPLVGQGPGPSPQTTRPRARSNVDMFPPAQIAQPQSSNISKWQNDVQASQIHGQPPAVIDQRPYREPNPPPQPGYPAADAAEVPFDPGPPPNFDGVKLSKKQQKAVLESWQRQKDDFLRYQASQGRNHKRSKSQTRFAEEQYADFSRGGVTFPQPGRGSNPNSDVERSMSRLTLSGLNPKGGNTTAAERQAQRGRRLSGGVLGLSGSMAQQQAAQQAAQQEQMQRAAQQEQMQRNARERSRSRQPQDGRYMSEDYGARQGYPGNISNIDHGISGSQQPTVVPRGNTQYATPYSVQQSTPAARYVQAQGNQPQRSPSFYTQPITPQEPQPSPIYGQQILPTQPVQIGGAQYSPSQFVPVQLGSVQTAAIPLGHVSNYPGFPQAIPGLSPLPGTLDLGTGPQYMTPVVAGQPILGYQPDPRTPAKRKTNIAEVMGNVKQQQQQFPTGGAPYHIDKTLITPAPEEPRHLRKSNISEYMHTRNKSEPLAQSGYVSAAPIPPAEPPKQVNYPPPSYPPPSHPPPSHRPNLSVSTIGLTGQPGVSPAGGPPSGQPPVVVRPPFTQNESASSLPSVTGPQGFGNRPTHVRQPSYKAALRDNGQDAVAESPRSELPVVSMRKPDPNMEIKHFDPKVITYDLNSEHRLETPMRFGRFAYDRDVNHAEWELFTKQILDTWAERNPAFNHYHQAVKRIQDILMAWNFAFFNPRGMDVVLFKGNERRSGNGFGEPEPNIDFATEAGPVSEPETSSEEEEEHPNHYLMNRAEAHQRAQQIALKEQQRELRRAKQLEAPHSLVIYDIPIPHPQAPEPQPGYR